MKHESKKLPSIQRMAFGDHQSIAPLTHEAGQYLEVARNANRAWDAIQSVHERRMRDETLTPFARLEQSADHADGHLKRIAAAHDAAAHDGINAMERLNRRLEEAAAPPASAGYAAVDSEIRQWAKTAKAEELVSALSDDGDPAIARALATAPRALSGIAELLHQKARGLHLSRVAPEEWEQFRNLVACSQAARTAVDNLKTWSNGMIDFGSVAAHKRAQGT